MVIITNLGVPGGEPERGGFVFDLEYHDEMLAAAQVFHV